MTTFEKLRQLSNSDGQAVTMSIKLSGEVLIYVNPNATTDEVMKSLLMASAEIAKFKDGEQ